MRGELLFWAFMAVAGSTALEPGPVLSAIFARAERIAPGERVRLNHGSFLPVLTIVEGGGSSGARIVAPGGEPVEDTTLQGALRCAAGPVQCELEGGGVIVEVLDHRLTASDELRVTVGFSFMERRRSGATAVCTRLEEFRFSGAPGWKLRETTPLRLC